MDQILQSILDMVKTHGSLAMLVGGITEQIIVPIPSPIISMSGGAFLISPNNHFFQSLLDIILKVSLPYSIGAVLGTSLIFLIAFFGGQPIIDKFGKYVGIKWSLIEKIKADFKKTISDELFILIAISIPVVPVSLITAFCGGFRIKPIKFYPLAFLALIIRSTILGFLGFKMGEAFTEIANGLDKIESILTVVIAVLVLGFLFLQREKWLKKNS
ncbi:MAG TPA: VTT domain-containing protein [Spirochaetia bacterium]|nr:VTT domain-containing protein [Spirochaetia bacterium]